jgi:hypothetical protein
MSTASTHGVDPEDPGPYEVPHADDPHDSTPPADRKLLGIAGVLLAVPVIALLWVGSYARVEPRLGGFPFFLWYQMLWVFLSTLCTYAAYRLVLRARPHRPMRRHAAETPR